jgi:drug/metabolite transporter (DMT)-like permease
MIGGSEANFWRLSIATFFLAIWAYGFGQKMEGDSFPIFLWSGIIGIGAGDVALFQALPRLGSRVTILIIQCLSAPFAALIEWLWLGTKLTGIQMLFGAIILGGVLLALTPSEHLKVSRRQIIIGSLLGIFAALGNAFGAVLTRKGYAVATAAGQNIDGGTAAFQRIVGGLFVAGIWLLIVKQQTGSARKFSSHKEKWRKAWPWVLANGFAGQTLGVSCYQLALKHAATGIVMPIIATTPLVVIPFAHFLEAEKPTVKSIIGGAIAVLGVIGLVLSK